MGEMRRLENKTLKIIPERINYYATIIGVDYGRITIHNQRVR